MTGVNQRLWQRLRRNLGKAVGDFGLIKEGDRIAVGVSGGKDSFTLLLLLKELQRRAPVAFKLCAINIDSGYPGYRSDIIEGFLKEQQLEYRMVTTGHYAIIKDKRRPGSSYCSICARLKRGSLYSAVQDMGCNKLALGHHRDDFVETLLLNQFFVGSLKAMAPPCWLTTATQLSSVPWFTLPKQISSSFQNRQNCLLSAAAARSAVLPTCKGGG